MKLFPPFLPHYSYVLRDRVIPICLSSAKFLKNLFPFQREWGCKTQGIINGTDSRENSAPCKGAILQSDMELERIILDTPLNT